MAKEKTDSFPMLPVKHWWTLRDKFKQSIPGTVTDNYLATVLNVTVSSARTNILPSLKSFGLIDEDGKTGELVKQWRDDKQYSSICEKLRKKLYPDELLNAVSKPSEDREAVIRWFANHTGAGKTAVGRMVAIYLTISDADISKATPDKGTNKINKNKAKQTPKDVKSKSTTKPDTHKSDNSVQPQQSTNAPSVNINLEIHISSDATPDQIDKIFESMARHIYKK